MQSVDCELSKLISQLRHALPKDYESEFTELACVHRDYDGALAFLEKHYPSELVFGLEMGLLWMVMQAYREVRLLLPKFERLVEAKTLIENV